MKYICENPDCPECGKEEYMCSETYSFRGNRLVGKHADCPVCGRERKEVNPNANIKLSEKNVGILKFSTASAEGKREMLKRRSHDHYEKEIRPIKEEKLRKAVESFKEASKN